MGQGPQAGGVEEVEAERRDVEKKKSRVHWSRDGVGRVFLRRSNSIGVKSPETRASVAGRAAGRRGREPRGGGLGPQGKGQKVPLARAGISTACLTDQETEALRGCCQHAGIPAQSLVLTFVFLWLSLSHISGTSVLVILEATPLEFLSVLQRLKSDT